MRRRRHKKQQQEKKKKNKSIYYIYKKWRGIYIYLIHFLEGWDAAAAEDLSWVIRSGKERERERVNESREEREQQKKEKKEKSEW